MPESTLTAAVDAAYKVFAYAVHPDDELACRSELSNALAPFLTEQLDHNIAGVLESYGLAEGDVVRFPRQGKTRPDVGVVMGLNKDGSVECMCERTKFARSIQPQHLERKSVGPRGGERWEKVI